MNAKPSSEINPKRLAIGIVVGAAVPIIAFAIVTAPIWPVTVAVGTVFALILIPSVVWPAYRILKAKRILTVFWAIFLGGLTATLPLVIITATGQIGDSTSIVTDYSGQVLIDKGKLTPSGWYTYFVLRPLFIFPLGAVGGLAAWLIGVGWRIKA